MAYSNQNKDACKKNGGMKETPVNILSVKAWGKTTVMDFLEKFNRDSQLKEEILKFMSKLEREN